MLLAVAVVAVPCGAVAACTGATAETPPGTVGAIEPPPTLETLLPVVTDSTIEVLDTGSVAPGTMFGGNLCSALTEGELLSVASLVPPSGTDPENVGSEETVVEPGAVGVVAVSADACRFVVREPVRYSVLVRIRSVFDYESPELVDPTGSTLVEDTVTGIGVGAIGVASGVLYEVVVKVDDGFFSVSAPDRQAAIRLARAAAERCCG
jgi:hypothetical protein